MNEILGALKEPDILEVIADLSNAEVRTPPKLANSILDLLPDEVWSNPELRWLDSGCKTGVFLREVAKRLIVGLEDAIPDKESRLEHILHNMIFGIATTEISSLMTRRSLYGSKDAAGEMSMVRMATSNGNVWFSRINHKFLNGRCSECRAASEQWGNNSSDNHAYGFIHEVGFEAIGKEMDMKFDVIVGNPPYHMTGGGGGSNDTPLYDIFLEQAKALNPKYISMIIPSRWMAGGRGLEQFRERVLTDNRLRVLVDYPNASELFPGVEIKGGVCYFLWTRDTQGPCEVTVFRGDEKHGPIQRELNEFDIFVRDSRALEILRKVHAQKEETLEKFISGDTPFGLATNFGSIEKTRKANMIEIHAIRGGTRTRGWINRDSVNKNVGLIDEWKVLIPEAYGAGETAPHQILGQPIIARAPSCCTQSYLVAGPFMSEFEAASFDSYVRTKFFRMLVSIRKISQHAFRHTYSWVPIQKWDRTWTDAQLYKKYGISPDEQAYIDSMVKEMPE